MTRDEQIEFVRELTRTVVDRFVVLANEGRVPADWDSHELREWLADKFDCARSNMSADHRLKRYRAYESSRYDNRAW